jgi:hypothetical protein
MKGKKFKMEITIPLKEMTTEEKIQAMELIWDDLCKKAESLTSPSWHEQILNKREERIKSGNDEFVDWEKSKKNIRNKVS